MAGIPAHLLAAIGRVESGRFDPATGITNPWPWSINAQGHDGIFDTKSDAIAAVGALQARGIRSIDVGCMQVNLMYHPQAFASLDEAFDPLANVRYAARFLNELFARTRNWPDAAALYHSANPDLGLPYQRKVLALWPAEQRARPVDTLRAQVANAWAATLAAGSPMATQPAKPFVGFAEQFQRNRPAGGRPHPTSARDLSGRMSSRGGVSG